MPAVAQPVGGLLTPSHFGVRSSTKSPNGVSLWQTPVKNGGIYLTPQRRAGHLTPGPWTESTMLDDRSWNGSVCSPVPTERDAVLTIPSADIFQPVALDAVTVASADDEYHCLVSSLRQQCIGEDEQVPCPIDGSPRKLIYCDYTASGRALKSVEDFITNQVCPMQGFDLFVQCRDISPATARQTAHFREEARERVRHYFNCSDDDSVIFCGAGATGAIRKFEDMLIKSRVFAPPRSTKKLRRAVVIVDPVAHHSSLLPFREMAKVYPLGRGVKSRSVQGSFVEVSKMQSSSEAIEVEVTVLPLDGVKGIASVDRLREVLEEISMFNRHHGGDYAIPVVVLSACSNVTGACQDLPTVSTLVHTFGGIIAWDCAAIAAHKKVDMNPVTHPEGYIDFAFLSPHKLLGGPGSSGILLCKKKRQTNAIPTICGGGTVGYVSSRGHYYIDHLEEREEAGTPDILGCIRAGAVYHIHSLLGIDSIAEHESHMASYLEERLRTNSKIHILGPKDRGHCAGIVSFNILYNEKKESHHQHNHGLYLHYNFVSCVLNDIFGIQARGGCACAGPYGEALLGLAGENAERFEQIALSTKDMIFKPGFVRVGVHFTMTQEELEYLAEAILWIADKGWMLMPAYTINLRSGEWKHTNRDEANVMKNLVDSLSPAMLRLPEYERDWVMESPTAHKEVVARDLLTALATPSERPQQHNQFGSPAMTASHQSPSHRPLSREIGRADKLVKQVAKEAIIAHREDPLIPAALSSVLWFALPIDVIWSLKKFGGRPEPRVCTDINVPIFTKPSSSNGRLSRKTESILNARIWSDRAPLISLPKPVPPPRPSLSQMLKSIIGQKVSCHASS
ncbi:hypothetical protein FOL47_009766 [Perkinsus chesapeaki]|uniref:Aminotransferase class V domain-containing protein n=1 Tax=Perkinsus chesapeaki TaxID=330153 RepID=A0A7J6L6N4_PERCH|nr:hypothetical protein FOL47_009766 [Perkinsus chesapeaki]